MLVEEVPQLGREEKGHAHVPKNKQTKKQKPKIMLENSNNEDQLEGCCISI